MIEILEFVFHSFWHFIGILILLMVILSPLNIEINLPFKNKKGENV
jgi:hypothetical protein